MKNPFINAGDADTIPRSGKSPAVGNGNPLQYSCLENPMDREEPGKLQSTGSQKRRKRRSNSTTVRLDQVQIRLGLGMYGRRP